MSTIDYVTDWATRMRSRLYTQFRDSPDWQAFSDMLAGLAQDWEDAAQGVLSIISIDDSSGVQLDNLGRIVGQPRTVADDALYRLMLKARALANRSEGTTEQVYKVFRALYGEDIGLVIVPSYIRSFVLRVVGVITGTQAIIGTDFLGDSKSSGERAILEWQEDVDSSMFCFDAGTGKGFDDGTGTVGGKLAGARQA